MWNPKMLQSQLKKMTSGTENSKSNNLTPASLSLITAFMPHIQQLEEQKQETVIAIEIPKQSV